MKHTIRAIWYMTQSKAPRRGPALTLEFELTPSDAGLVRTEFVSSDAISEMEGERRPRIMSDRVDSGRNAQPLSEGKGVKRKGLFAFVLAFVTCKLLADERRLTTEFCPVLQGPDGSPAKTLAGVLRDTAADRLKWIEEFCGVTKQGRCALVRFFRTVPAPGQTTKIELKVSLFPPENITIHVVAPDKTKREASIAELSQIREHLVGLDLWNTKDCLDVSDVIERKDGLPVPKEQTLYSGVWAVPEARNTEFLGLIREIIGEVQNQPENAQVEPVVTVYCRTPGVRGVGRFEFDLLYRFNVRHAAQMFGPIVADDDRITFLRNEKPVEMTSYSAAHPSKENGFAWREDILTAAKVMLGPSLWVNGNNPGEPVEEDRVEGLLFLNARHCPLHEATFASPKLRQALGRLGQLLPHVAAARRQHYGKLASLISDTAGEALPFKKIIEPTPTDIDAFFKLIKEALQKMAGAEEDKPEQLALTVYLAEKADETKLRLRWLWADGPTSSPALLLPSEKDFHVQLVADDKNHKPLVIAGLRTKAPPSSTSIPARESTSSSGSEVKGVQEREADIIVTRLGNDVETDVVVPILMPEENSPPKLVGIMDIQCGKDTTSDGQFIRALYDLAADRIAEFMDKLAAKTCHPPSPFPFSESTGYLPFPSIPFNFGTGSSKVQDLIALNYNPMKYLLHWDRIRPLALNQWPELPTMVEIWPSMLCNHHCTFCRTRPVLPPFLKRPFLNKTELESLGADLVKNPDTDVLISGGGEPLLNPNLEHFIDKVESLEGTLGIFTNGSTPNRFGFWQRFFPENPKGHRFVRFSLDGYSPKSYCCIHFDIAGTNANPIQQQHWDDYMNLRKSLCDVLALRTDRCSVSVGSTVRQEELDFVSKMIDQAAQLGVDFIQIRSELNTARWDASFGSQLRDRVEKANQKRRVMPGNRNDFEAVYTDTERADRKHDYDICWAMFLVPALIPDDEEGWFQLLPCSYAINNYGQTPTIGRFKHDVPLRDLWNRVGSELIGGKSQTRNDAIDIKLSEKINPAGCPQCRFYSLNKRIIAIRKEGNKGVEAIDELVKSLEQNPLRPEKKVVMAVTKLFGKEKPKNGDVEVVNVEKAKTAFSVSQQFGIRPSL